ncbi:MAG: DNA-deoxyinosine glycosylase [Oscillospiraceae bacterium]|nr:DNA-deoxyinosine glycosylase [Oscillospiraceae bacterium]
MTLHNIPPLYCAQSRILILGSFPSVKSREGRFFYHHPQNRFWRVMAAVLREPVPVTVEEKTALLLRRGVALWDVAAACEVTGSSDSSIQNVVPNDIACILETAPVRAIFCNGQTAFRLYQIHLLPVLGREAAVLPSTSPANAAWSLERLTAAWSAALLPVLEV